MVKSILEQHGISCAWCAASWTATDAHAHLSLDSERSAPQIRWLAQKPAEDIMDYDLQKEGFP